MKRSKLEQIRVGLRALSSRSFLSAQTERGRLSKYLTPVARTPLKKNTKKRFRPRRCGFCTGILYIQPTDVRKGRRYRVCEEHIAKIPDRKHKPRGKRNENRSGARSQRRRLMRPVYFREVDIALLRVSAGTLCLQFFSKSRVLFLALGLRVRVCLCFK